MPRWDDANEVFQLLQGMNLGELAAVHERAERLERDAAERLGVQAHVTGAAAMTLPSLTMSAMGTVTPPGGTGSAHAFGVTTWTGSAHGYAPPVPTPTDAVETLWQLIRPKSTQDALGISRDIRRWVLIVVFIVGGLKTPAILEAIQEEFQIDAVQEEVVDPTATIE